MMRFLLLALALLAASPGTARAAGHAHIVDDAEVETPGTCHVELWVSNFVGGDGYGNAAPACTLKSLPFVELGAAYAHYWGEALSAPVVGPQIKIRLSPPSSGLGLALGLNGGVNLNTSDFATGSILGLMTVPINPTTNININAGWSYLRYVDQQNALFYGAQIETKIGGGFLLMLETFGRVSQAAGVQMGLRYTPNDGPLDFDFMVGSYLDSVNPQFITFGVTFRF